MNRFKILLFASILAFLATFGVVGVAFAGQGDWFPTITPDTGTKEQLLNAIVYRPSSIFGFWTASAIYQGENLARACDNRYDPDAPYSVPLNTWFNDLDVLGPGTYTIFFTGGSPNCGIFTGKTLTQIKEDRGDWGIATMTIETTGPLVSIFRPENSTTTTNEPTPPYPNFWQINVRTGEGVDCSENTPCRVEVKFWKQVGLILINSASLTLNGDTLIGIPKTYTLADGLWTAKAFLYSNINYPLNLLAESSEITFTITGSDAPGGVISTSTLAETEIKCDTGNWFNDGLCGAFSFLFSPDPARLTRFNDIRLAIIDKPPIGYFTAIKNALSSFGGETTSTAIISTSTASAFGTLFDPIKTGLSWILWLLLAFWLFNRIRHLEL